MLEYVIKQVKLTNNMLEGKNVKWKIFENFYYFWCFHYLHIFKYSFYD